MPSDLTPDACCLELENISDCPAAWECIEPCLSCWMRSGAKDYLGNFWIAYQTTWICVWLTLLLYSLREATNSAMLDQRGWIAAKQRTPAHVLCAVCITVCVSHLVFMSDPHSVEPAFWPSFLPIAVREMALLVTQLGLFAGASLTILIWYNVVSSSVSLKSTAGKSSGGYAGQRRNVIVAVTSFFVGVAPLRIAALMASDDGFKILNGLSHLIALIFLFGLACGGIRYGRHVLRLMHLAGKSRNKNGSGSTSSRAQLRRVARGIFSLLFCAGLYALCLSFNIAFNADLAHHLIFWNWLQICEFLTVLALLNQTAGKRIGKKKKTRATVAIATPSQGRSSSTEVGGSSASVCNASSSNDALSSSDNTHVATSSSATTPSRASS